ncbi:excinuclease ABC subunit UvrA [Bacteroidales bacterium OttesenSCG-928-K22]|nr:excinuclease ABC subunit UvrA [Bacteroidales bacterium OttesenSCG-928-K22]
MIEQDNIHIEGARVNNLKNITLDIPRNSLVVITGVSGSGKSSLAFDTLYAEGQRRYVESLSSYARQFLGRITKPDVDNISGISPGIAIEQKVSITNIRSTVGTSTEIYEYLKLLFARLGKTFSPISGNEVKEFTVNDVVNEILNKEEKTRCYICFKILTDKNTVHAQLNLFLGQAYSRLLKINSDNQDNPIEIVNIENVLASDKEIKELVKKKEIIVLVDRIAVPSGKPNEDVLRRLTDSVETALYEGSGYCFVFSQNPDSSTIGEEFSNNYEIDGIRFEQPNPNLFSFNNPYGACPVCEGLGKVQGVDEDLVIPDRNLSVFQDAVACWRGEKMQEWKNALIANADACGFPVHKPIAKLSEKEYDMLWNGCNYFEGIKDFFKYVDSKSYKIQYKVLASRFRGLTACDSCRGSRLRKEALYVKFDGKDINQFVNMSVNELNEYFQNIILSKEELEIAGRIVQEIKQRIKFLSDVGLGYLTLNRLSSTLSGGETQRINLATALGSNLTGSMYILDEPSVGLHSRDTQRLIKTLKYLRDLGNSVIIVEHDKEIILEADYVIDIGPFAGRLGGEVVFAGTIPELKKSDTLTAKYLDGRMSVPIPKTKRKVKDFITIHNASQFNLKNITVKFPLNMITVVTGVSGSGKSTLVDGILYPALKKHFGDGGKPGKFESITGDINTISGVELVDQNPIGRSSRSNPVTYIGAFDEIRNLFSQQKLAKVRGYKPGNFSFNVPGGRCENCEGDGFTVVEMQFLADVTLVCEECEGKRFKEEILDVKYKDYSIYDILEMTINQAVELFEKGTNNLEKKIAQKLKPLQDVGLGYLKMGQSSSTLSGGEAQRVKLAYFLSKSETEKSKLFIFDEPTTGLHFHDIHKLMNAFNALVEKGNSIIIIEHNHDVINCADYIIELGPEGGDGGGYLLTKQ